MRGLRKQDRYFDTSFCLRLHYCTYVIIETNSHVWNLASVLDKESQEEMTIGDIYSLHKRPLEIIFIFIWAVIQNLYKQSFKGIWFFFKITNSKLFEKNLKCIPGHLLAYDTSSIRTPRISILAEVKKNSYKAASFAKMQLQLKHYGII